MKLSGKTVLITGGASGLGLESARQFLAHGSRVIICGRNQVKLDQAKNQLPSLISIKADVSDEAQIAFLFEEIAALGGIDILYNNAGVGSEPLNMAAPATQHFASAQYEMDVNYLGVIRLNNLFMDMLKNRTDAAIINTTSVLSYLPAILAPTYSASKAALRFYTMALRKHLEISGSSVKVFELLPPLVDTEMTTDIDEQKMSAEDVVKVLIDAIFKDQFVIRVGQTKMVYFMNRFFPNLAFSLLNKKKDFHLLKEKNSFDLDPV